jgi:hypothetical protein
MSYSYNRTAFSHGRIDITSTSSALLSAYVRLVSIEMILINHLRYIGCLVKNSHDVPDLLDELKAYLTGSELSVLTSLETQLLSAMGRLWCQGKSKIAPCPRHSYPYIRYVRIDSDFPTECSTHADVEDFESVAQQLQMFLFSVTGETV